jgi:multidrug resistance efflux pump
MVSCMLRIRKRPRFDNLVNQQRSTTASWGRRIYLTLLLLLGVGVLNYLIGDVVLLRADGILLSDRYVVAATYPGRISAVNVKEGDPVKAGASLFQLDSAEMLRNIADLSLRTGELSTRITQLRMRAATIASLMPLAERQAQETSQTVARVDKMSARGLISSQAMNQNLSAEYDSAARLADLRVQAGALSKEITVTEGSYRKASAAFAQLEVFYDRGEFRAPASGVIGPRVPVVGQVAKYGDELLQIYGQKTYVLAYLPDMYLFSVSPGDRVEVTGGPGSPSVTGTVEAILGVADSLPPEFQNMFRPRDRSRLMRISLPRNSGFAISQKVRVGGCIAGWCWRGMLPK